MRTLIVALLLAGTGMVPGAALAAEKAKKVDPAQVQKDVADHLALAEAHMNAAKCLQSGKPEKECHAQLEKDCKGLGIGKYCGMKHKH